MITLDTNWEIDRFVNILTKVRMFFRNMDHTMDDEETGGGPVKKENMRLIKGEFIADHTYIARDK